MKFTKELKEEFTRNIEKSITKISIYSLINADLITHAMRHALATGNWGVSPKGDIIRHGVSQALS